MTPKFLQFDWQNGLLHNLEDDAFPANFYAWKETGLNLQNQATYFGFVAQGSAQLTTENGTFKLQKGMYFAVPSTVKIEGGQGILIEQLNYQGLFQIGGQIEDKGRLNYIDGCTDTLLIAPPILGDPCLNLLHIPANIFQTQHTHPSFRIGIIARGTGHCITPDGEHPLHSGLIFIIPTNLKHSFRTKDDDLLVVAYHPDSDFGPTHENHPMINRTIL